MARGREGIQWLLKTLINPKLIFKKGKYKLKSKNRIVEIGPNITAFSINKNGKERITEQTEKQ